MRTWMIVLAGMVMIAGGRVRAQALDEVKLPADGVAIGEEKPEVTKHTLEAGKKFEGRKYGSEKGELVCTTYAAGVLEEAGYRVGKLGMKVINIQWGWSTSEIEQAVQTNDPKASGVVLWLIASKQGTAVRDYKDVRPGDFVQYWRWVTDKKTGKVSMAGHTAQVAKVLGEGRVRLHGSHLSKGGVGYVDVGIIPTQRKPGEKGMYRTWVARPAGNSRFEK